MMICEAKSREGARGRQMFFEIIADPFHPANPYSNHTQAHSRSLTVANQMDISSNTCSGWEKNKK